MQTGYDVAAEIRPQETTVHDRMNELDAIANQTRALAEILLGSLTGAPMDSPARERVTGLTDRTVDLIEFTSTTRAMLERCTDLLGVDHRDRG